jgi:hypothetical protein
MNVYRNWAGEFEAKATGHLSIDGGIILKWILGFDIVD